jgi:hypothetical protein
VVACALGAGVDRARCTVMGQKMHVGGPGVQREGRRCEITREPLAPPAGDMAGGVRPAPRSPARIPATDERHVNAHPKHTDPRGASLLDTMPQPSWPLPHDAVRIRKVDDPRRADHRDRAGPLRSPRFRTPHSGEPHHPQPRPISRHHAPGQCRDPRRCPERGDPLHSCTTLPGATPRRPASR